MSKPSTALDFFPKDPNTRSPYNWLIAAGYVLCMFFI